MNNLFSDAMCSLPNVTCTCLLMTSVSADIIPATVSRLAGDEQVSGQKKTVNTSYIHEHLFTREFQSDLGDARKCDVQILFRYPSLIMKK